MDDWNRNDRNEYTGVTAQRRNRRRADSGQTGPAGTPREERARDLREFSGNTAVSGEYRRFMRPEQQDPPEEEPVKAEKAEEPEEVREAEQLRQAEESGEEEKTEAFREATAPLAPEETGLEPESRVRIAKRPEPAEEEGPSAVVQGSDSRVPPEARRMAAAPYGTVRTAQRRPGTRPQAPQGREVLPEDRQPAAQSRRGMYSGSSSRAAERKTVPSREPRVRVGYEPGRMSEGMTQQVPAGETVREQLYGRDAKAYLEKRRQPFRTEDDGRIPDTNESRKLRIAVVVLLAIGALLIGGLIIRSILTRNSGSGREAPQVISFGAGTETPTAETLTAPVVLTYKAVTDNEAGEIRLRAEDGTALETEASYADNTEGRRWMMYLHLNAGFSGTVVLQVRRGDGEEWFDTEYTTEVNVNGPLIPDGTENAATPTPDPEDEDYFNIGEETEKAGDADGESENGAEPAGVIPETEAEEDPDEIPEEEPEQDPETETEEVPEDVPEEDGELPIGELKTPEMTEALPTETPEPTATPPLTAEAAADASPDLITNTTIWTSNTKKVKEYNRPAKELIHMPAGDEYTKKQLGVMTFRGDNFRRNASVGTLSAAPAAMKTLWTAEGGSARGTSQTFYGYGWTGQPVIARWSTEVRAHSNILESKIEKKALKEVIIAGLDGVVRFLDLETGEITRKSNIKLGYPMRGTPSLHPRGYPFMSVGQFARKMRGKTGQIGMRQYNLFSLDPMKMIDGLDGKFHRPVNDIGSFETSALIDRESDTLIAIGSSGMLYLESLDSTFDYNTGVMQISPSFTVMTSKVKGQKNKAMAAVESSPAAYDKYVFYADMGGVLRCVDTDTLRPVWAVDTGDSVMAAVALDLTETRELNLYTANMLNNRKKGDSSIQIRRYDALSGKQDWTADIGVHKGKKDKADVGAKASPVIGQHSLGGLVYFTVTGLSGEGRDQLGLRNDEPAALIALNKDTGKVVWAFGLSSRSESSPVAVYDDAGNGWIVQGEQNGMLHLLDGLTGSEVTSMQLEGEIEASPAAYNNVVVIGTTGKNTAYIYGIELKYEQTQEE